MNLYVVADVVSGKYFECFFANSNGEALRNNLPALCRLHRKDDIKIFRVAELSDDFKPDCDINLVHVPDEDIPLDSYHFDEITAESMNKTEAQKQIELWKRSRELQLERIKKELDEEMKQVKENQ